MEKEALVSMISQEKIQQNESTLLQTCTVSIGNIWIFASVLCDSSFEKSFVKKVFVKKSKIKAITKKKFISLSFWVETKPMCLTIK